MSPLHSDRLLSRDLRARLAVSPLGGGRRERASILRARLAELCRPPVGLPVKRRLEVVWSNNSLGCGRPEVRRVADVPRTLLATGAKVQTIYSTSNGVFVLWHRAA